MRLDADLPQFVDAVLGRLGLELAGGAEIGHQRDVDVQDVLPSHVVGKLADGLQERQALDVTHRPPDLCDDNVHAVRPGADGLLDLVSDVRHDLDRPAQVVATALLHDDVVVDAPGREVIAPPDGHGREPLVVPEVEVGLRSVLRHVDLAVLVGIHRPRVHIDIGVDFQESEAGAAAFQEIPDGCGREALPQRRHYSAGHKDEFRHAGFPPICTPPLYPPAPAPRGRGLFPWSKRVSVVARSWPSDVFIDALLPV